MRYLALGDSYTIGEGVDPADRWPNVLCRRLRMTDLQIDDAQIVAKTGWTTDELSAAMDNATLAERYDLVSLLIGVNNQYRGRDCNVFRGELDALMKRAIRLAGDRPRRVILVSIPDWTVTPFFRSTDRDLQAERNGMKQYNQACVRAARQAGTRFVDITDLSNAMGQKSKLVTADGLHPSAALYRSWVDRMYPVAQRALTSSL